MSTKILPLLKDTKVRVIFKGFFLAKIKETRAGTRGEAMIGAIDPSLTPPAVPPLACHQPVVQVLGLTANGVVKTVTNVPTDPNQDFSLTVRDAQNAEITPDIKRFQKDDELFNRLDERENLKKDLRWFVDFDDLHKLGEPVSVNDSKLKPKFTTNKGVFHSSDLSDGEVRFIKKNHPSKPNKRFGRFATEITARVTLDTGTKAVFKKGDGTQIFTIPDASKPDIDRYEIVFDCECRDREEDSDFELIYTYRLVTNVNEQDQVSLPPDRRLAPGETAIEGLDFSPEVYCMGGGFGGP